MSKSRLFPFASATLVCGLVVAGLAACSSSGGGPSGGLGFHGGAFPTTDQIWYPTSSNASGYQFRLTDYGGACGLYEADDTHKQNSTYAEIDIYSPDGSTSVSVTKGTYVIGGTTLTVGANIKSRDAGCNKTSSSDATAGSVTFDDDLVQGSTVHGSYSFTMEDGSVAEGSFTASSCGLLQPGTSACVP